MCRDRSKQDVQERKADMEFEGAPLGTSREEKKERSVFEPWPSH